MATTEFPRTIAAAAVLVLTSGCWRRPKFDPLAAYQACLAEVERLLSDGFNQDDLSRLSRAIPRLFWLHKEWTPQLERAADGRFQEPTWFAAADELHQKVQDAAEELRIVGRY